MGAADRGHRQLGHFRQGRQAAGTATMIKLEFFRYTDEDWNKIREQVLNDLGVNIDPIKEPLRSRIEVAASVYHFFSDASRRSPRRNELVALGKDAVDMFISIINTFAIPVGVTYDTRFSVLWKGVDGDMLTATRDYFTKLERNLDRQIEQATSPCNNARKPVRDQFWIELLAIWCELGGKTRGIAAANFLIVASKPVMGSAVPDRKSVVQWLERHEKALRREVR
jgi:hypothetical protein